jgi:hypothetical protein
VDKRRGISNLLKINQSESGCFVIKADEGAISLASWRFAPNQSPNLSTETVEKATVTRLCVRYTAMINH